VARDWRVSELQLHKHERVGQILTVPNRCVVVWVINLGQLVEPRLLIFVPGRDDRTNGFLYPDWTRTIWVPIVRIME
jgi:hypothetical protein